MAVPFTLLCLPSKPLHNILMEFEFAQILPFSLTSAKSKNLVKSLKLINDNSTLKVSIGDSIKISACERMVIGNGSVQMSHYRSGIQHIYTWKSANLSERDLIDHIIDITENSEIMELYFKSDYHNVIFLHNCFKGLKIGKLRSGVNSESFQAFQKLIPSDKLDIEKDTGDHEMSGILCQNLNQLVIWTERSVSLDDLFLNNALAVKINSAQFDYKDLNLFLKSWISGSNPRLEYLTLHFSTRHLEYNTMEYVLGGIDFQKKDYCDFSHDLRSWACAPTDCGV